MGLIPPTVRPGGFSPDMPCAATFILDPYSGGAHGQGLLPEPELGPPPTDRPGPLCPHPSAGKSECWSWWARKPVLTQNGRTGSRARPTRWGHASTRLPGFLCHPRERCFLSWCQGASPCPSREGILREEAGCLGTRQPLLPSLQSSLQLCSQKGEEDMGVSQRGIWGGWDDPVARTGGQGRGWVPTHILKYVPGRLARNQGASGQWLERMVRVPPAERLESGVPPGGDRLSKSHPNHEPRGSLGVQRGQTCRESWEGRPRWFGLGHHP